MLLQILLLLVVLYSSLRAFPKTTFRFISCFLGPIVRIYILRRISKGLEDKNRINERFGIPSEKRPDGKLIWIHSVSVGETLSVIPIIEEIKREAPNVSVLLTTTTLTAAQQIEKRLGDKVIHQFIPFDIFMWVRRFIKFWKPSAVIFVESELWPNTLYYLHEKDIPTYLFNVRVSDKSLRRMFFVRDYLGILPYSLFTEVFVPSTEVRNYVRDLGARETKILPNMKTISEKLPVNESNQKKLVQKIAGRKVWLAVSTHPGEEEIILGSHKKLKKKFSDILTVIALRHPNRKDELKELVLANKLTSADYSTSIKNRRHITEDIFIIDAMGCLGEFFETIDTVLVCGSLVPGIGGHNFLEPLNFACNVATGPHIDNFKDIYKVVEKYCSKVDGVEEIADFVGASIENYNRDTKRLKELDFKKEWQKIIKNVLKAI